MTSNALSTTAKANRSGLTKLDQTLIRHAANGKSPDEISRLTGIPAAQVTVRVQDVLHSRDVWTEHERFMMFLDDLYDLKAKLQVKVGNELDNKDVSNLIRVLEQLNKALDKQTKINNEVSDKITRVQAQALMGMIVSAFDHAKKVLADEYPDVDLARIDGAFQEGLAKAVIEDEEDEPNDI